MTADPATQPPLVVRTRAALWDARWRLPGRVALVPTMGALHRAHVELIRAARRSADAVVVSIFVNPLQFGPGEDFDRYPRSLDDDLRMCRDEGVELAFVPPVEEMYAAGGPQVRVTSGPLGSRLEGASRPGHFDGVLTVVTKLLHLTQPALAVFGEKDAQQLALVQQLVRDLDFPVQILPVPVVREDDGLALSSRNRYLSPAERRSALALSRALAAGAAAAAGDDAAGDDAAGAAAGPGAAGAAEGSDAPGGVDVVLAAARRVLDAEPGVRVDYLRLVGPDLGDVPAGYHGAARLLVAAHVGRTRLLDNRELAV